MRALTVLPRKAGSVTLSVAEPGTEDGDVEIIDGESPPGRERLVPGHESLGRVHVLDRVTGGPKPDPVHDLGATYHAQPPDESDMLTDVVVECTGAVEADHDRLERILTRRVGLDGYGEEFGRAPEDVNVVLGIVGDQGGLG